MDPTTSTTGSSALGTKQPAAREETKRKLEAHSQEAAAQGREALEASKEALSAATGRFKQQGREAVEATTHLAQETGERLKQQSFEFLDRQKRRMASEVQALSDAARKASIRLEEESDTNLAKYVSQGADRLERLGRRMEQKSVHTAVRELGDFTRRHPEAVFGGLFVAGLAFTRFLKASKPPRRDSVELEETVEVIPAKSPSRPAFGAGNGRQGPARPVAESPSSSAIAGAGATSTPGPASPAFGAANRPANAPDPSASADRSPESARSGPGPDAAFSGTKEHTPHDAEAHQDKPKH